MDVSTETTSADSTESISTESVDTSTDTSSTQTGEETQSTQVDDSVEGFIASKQAALGNTVEAAQGFTPTFKYKANNEEKELPEMFRGLIKDAATEKQVKELFEKADGLEGVKKLRDELKTKYEGDARGWEQYKAQAEPVVSGYKAAQHFWQTSGYDDKKGFSNLAAMDNLIKTLGLPEKAFLHYAAQKLNVNDLPPEHQSVYNTTQEQTLQNYQYQQQLAQYQQQEFETKRQQAENLLSQAMSTPDVAQAVQQFNTEKASADAFRNEVLVRARIYGENGINKMPDEIVKEIIANRGLSQAQPQAQGNVTPITQAASRPPVIPVIKGGGVNTVKRKVNSIADIEKAYESLE